MDPKKKIILSAIVWLMSVVSFLAAGQDVATIRLMDKQYAYDSSSDSIAIFFNVIDSQGERQGDLSPVELANYLVLRENGAIIPENCRSVSLVAGGRRIPADYTFSVLVDQGIPSHGKQLISQVIGSLVDSAPDSCVFLSFFGDNVQTTRLVTRENYEQCMESFLEDAGNKYLYSALFSKLAEFSPEDTEEEGYIVKEPGYVKNPAVAARAESHPDKNFLFIFTEGNRRPTLEENLAFLEVSEYQSGEGYVVPVVYAFYYTENGDNPEIHRLLEGICTPVGHPERKGAYMPAGNMEQVVQNFKQIVDEKSYDYAFTYRIPDGKSYSGKTDYLAEWKGSVKGQGSFSIGSPERPWPNRPEMAGDSAVKFLVAFLVAFLVYAFFFFASKILIPWIRCMAFKKKYYKVYVPEENVRRRVCYYCGQEIEPGQQIVVRCKHIMHVSCWKQNDYHCSEFGQNCKDGIQPHVHGKELFTKTAFRESIQMLSGVIAALVAWMVYDLCGRGGLMPVAEWIVGFSLREGLQQSMFADCVERTSAFLMIGLLLGFFLSLVFRYNDEYRNKDGRILLKILGLSVLSGLVGMLAFGIGAIVLCGLAGISGTTYIPWYCSLPAYILFALSVSALLSWKSSIPIKSALLGGGIASVIGFIVLFCSPISGGWVNMLLDFIIFGGGLGASLVTVRMLSEHYFLIIKNGVRAGQRIPIHKWINATGGWNKVSIGMTGECEIQMNWEKSNKVAKEHARLYIDSSRSLPMIKTLATGVIFNNRSEIPVGKPFVLSNGDTFKIGDTIFEYVESE